jgi:hypothetical protein
VPSPVTSRETHPRELDMRRIFALFGFAGCALSSTIHLMTFFGVDPMMIWPQLWTVHLLAMLALLSTFFSGHRLGRAKSGRSIFGEIFGPWDAAEARAQLEKSLHATVAERGSAEEMVVRRFRPRPVAVALICLAFYALANFTISISLLGGGVPERQGDSYRLISHGKVLRDLSVSEYRWHRAYQTRLATGHWMVVFLLAGVLWQAPRRMPLELV